MRPHTLLATSLVVLLTAACQDSGSSSGSGSRAPKGPVDISVYSRPLPGDRATFEMVGEFTENGYFTEADATFRWRVGPEERYLGETVLPRETRFTVREPGSGAVSRTEAELLITPDGFPVASFRDDGLLCEAVESRRLPRAVAVGDRGFHYREVCSDGSETTVRWRALAGYRTLDLKLIYTGDGPGSGDSFDGVEIFRFNTDGTPHSLRREGTLFDAFGSLIYIFDGPVTTFSF